MLKIDTLTLGIYQTNCYIVSQPGAQDCIVIDPGYDPDTILTFLSNHNLTVGAILLTHGHFDHVGGVKAIAMDTDCPVYLHEADLSMPPMMTAGPLYYTNTYSDGDVLTIADITVQVLHTPGHTPGSVCLKMEGAMFSGDTLFAGSCGRTDLPSGNSAALRQSLKRLAELQEDVDIYPGHGESTTLFAEKQYNPYM